MLLVCVRNPSNMTECWSFSGIADKHIVKQKLCENISTDNLKGRRNGDIKGNTSVCLQCFISSSFNAFSASLSGSYSFDASRGSHYGLRLGNSHSSSLRSTRSSCLRNFYQLLALESTSSLNLSRPALTLGNFISAMLGMMSEGILVRQPVRSAISSWLAPWSHCLMVDHFL